MSIYRALKLLRSTLLALALVAVGLVAALSLWQWTQQSPTLLPLAAVALAAWLTGRIPGLIAAVAAALAAEYFLHTPKGFNWDLDDFVRLSVYLGVAILVSQLAYGEDRAVAGERRIRGHLSMITEALPVLIAYVDRAERYQFVNSAYAEWFGIPRDFIRGQTIRQVVGDAMYEAMREPLSRARRGEMVNYERDFTLPDGRQRTALATYIPEFDTTGAVAGFAVIVADVSERRRAEAAVRASEQKFHLMADNAPVMIWIAGVDQHCTWFNQPWLQFAGRSMDEELGWGWLERVHPDDVERCRRIHSESFAARQAFKMEYRLRRHDGEYRWLLDDGRPLWGAEGEFDGFIGSCVDITERKEHEQEREYLLASERHARGESERISHLKDQFLATLSHELRTPLNGILGWAQVLHGSTDREEIAQGLEVIERNARVQTQIISDLLDMSRIISGKVPLEIRPVDLAMLLHQCVQTVQHSADAKGIRVERHIAHDLGTITADAARLQQVVWNLLSNAIKFTPKGGVVRLEASRVQGEAKIAVIDSGKGIEPQFLPHVFERFRQADASTTRKHGGLGLGLSIARSLVEMHGGSIEASSDGPGTGARFDVTLPVASVERPSAPETIQPRQASVDEEPAAAPKLEGVRVLAIDDEPDARELMRRVLAEQGAQVETAGDADEAIAILSRDPFDVLLSDIGMPDCDGYDLIRRIRSGTVPANPKIPAAAVTAFARSEDRTRALLSGYQGYISKPYEPSELVAVVASLSGTLTADSPETVEARE